MEFLAKRPGDMIVVVVAMVVIVVGSRFKGRGV